MVYLFVLLIGAVIFAGYIAAVMVYYARRSGQAFRNPWHAHTGVIDTNTCATCEPGRPGISMLPRVGVLALS